MLALLKSGRVSFALAASFCALVFAGNAAAQQPRPRPIGTLYAGVPASDEPAAPATSPEPCSADCFLLSSLSLRGSVSAQMSFELKGGVRDRSGDPRKVPLFGPPDQV